MLIIMKIVVMIIVKNIKKDDDRQDSHDDETLSWSSLIRPLSVREVVRSSSVLSSWFCDDDDQYDEDDDGDYDDHYDHDHHDYHDYHEDDNVSEILRPSSLLVKNIVEISFLVGSHLELWKCSSLVRSLLLF